MKFIDTLRSLLMPSVSEGMLFSGVHTYGDSIMAGNIATELRNTGAVVLDYSQPGDTAANAWRRFSYDKRSMSTVVLQHGTNDLTLGDDPVPYLEMMAKRAIAEGRKVVFTGITQRAIPPARSWLGTNADITELAYAMGCQHAKWHIVPMDLVDGLHPGASMIDQLVNRLESVL